jgi:hypothetical protein
MAATQRRILGGASELLPAWWRRMRNLGWRWRALPPSSALHPSQSSARRLELLSAPPRACASTRTQRTQRSSKRLSRRDSDVLVAGQLAGIVLPCFLRHAVVFSALLGSWEWRGGSLPFLAETRGYTRVVYRSQYADAAPFPEKAHRKGNSRGFQFTRANSLNQDSRGNFLFFLTVNGGG